jgi:hypothetical protein
LSEDGRRFCENCGTEIRQTANFCPTCGAAQHPDPEVPSGPPPPIPEPGSISTPTDHSVPLPPEEPQRQHAVRNALIVFALIILLIILMIRDCLGGAATKGGGGASTDPKATTQQASAADSNPHFSDGTYQVGKDIQPGTYRTRKGSKGCYYARLKGFSGGTEDILANDNTNDPAIVTIASTDTGFESKRCDTWTQDLSAITSSTTSFADGTYIVGTDIDPGTYKSSGSSDCYYARLSGFSGDTGDILANDNTNTSAVVTVAPTDTGFESKRCGTWTKIS